MAICSKADELDPADRIEILCILAADSNSSVRENAAAVLLTQPLDYVLAALQRPGAAPEMFAYCAAEFPRRPGVAEALARNPSCPLEALRPVVRYLSVSAVQEVFEDLDLLSTSPHLVAELIASEVVTSEQRSQLLELQKQELDSVEAFAEAAQEAEPDPHKRETLLQRLARLRVVERVQLALKGGRDERLLLIRDPCKVVQRAVLQSPKLTMQEVESYAGMRTLSEEALRLISINRKYRKNYIILRSLMFNPKTPLEITLHLLPLMKATELKLLTADKNIADTLRTAAFRLQRQRTSERQS
ncbi:MAG TPA: hypothetical protein VGT24_01860 [Candidatus Acidoferrales bacterium]|nr:hypothetical protein [Candidatus Acidoferrales bacterium]